MEKTRKNLKMASILVLVFAGLTVVELILALALGALDVSVLPAGAPENLVLIMQIVVVTLSLLLLIPQVYVGLRGLQLAKTPAPTKGHIIWAILLASLAAVSLLSPVIALFQGVNVGDNLSAALSILLETVIFVDYAKCAIDLLKETK